MTPSSAEPSAQAHWNANDAYRVHEDARDAQGRLMSMDWDAFGLPVKNAAMDKLIVPAAWTRGNIADTKAQFKPLGLAFDWTREVATCNVSHYRWKHWFFRKLLGKGVAYRKTQVENRDPVDQPVHGG